MIVDHHEMRVRAGAVELEHLDNAGTLTLDAGWTPHAQGRIIVRSPSTLSTTAPGATVVLELTQRFGDFALTRDLTALHSGDTTADLTAAYAGGTSATLTALITAGSWNSPVKAATGRRFELYIISRVRTRDTHELQLASLEAILQDWLWYDVDASLEGVPVTVTAHSPTQLLEALIAAHQTQSTLTPPVIVPLASPFTLSTTSHTLQPGDQTIGYLDQYLTQARQRMHSPGDGTLLVTDNPYLHASAITVESGVNLIDWEITDERDPGVMIRFEGTVSSPTARPIYSSLAFPELNPPHEVLVEAPHAFKAADGFFNASVREIDPYLARRGLDESPIRLATINDYSVRPGSSITYTLPDEAEDTDVVDAVTWQLGGTFEMDIWI